MAKYIFSKASTELLANEAAVEEARQSVERPAEKKPLLDLFPEFILQSKLPKKIPEDSDEYMLPLFVKAGFTSAKVYKEVQGGINSVMKLTGRERATFRFDSDPIRRFLSVCSIAWPMGSKKKSRDHFPWGGGAFLEHIIIPRYRPVVLKGPMGYIRDDLMDLILTCVEELRFKDNSTGRSFKKKRWEYVDGLETPRASLPPRELYLGTDLEKEYEARVARVSLRDQCQRFLDLASSLPAGKVFRAPHRKRAEVEEARKQGKSTEREPHMPWDVTGRPSMANEVASAASKFLRVRLSSSSFSLFLILNLAFSSFIRRCK